MSKKISILEQAERFINRYSFTYEEWLLEIDNFEVNFYIELIELYERDREEFLDLLFCRKKQRARLLKVKQTTNRKLNLKPKRDRLQSFFEQVPVKDYMCDIYLMPDIFEYEVVDQFAQYNIGVRNEEGELEAFPIEALQDEKLKVTFEEKEFKISLQALIYFVCVNEMMHERDKERLTECEDIEEEYLFA